MRRIASATKVATDRTLSFANSACAFSGLNDMDPAEGQTASIVQTAADAFKYYGLWPGVQGTLGLCKGGTN